MATDSINNNYTIQKGQTLWQLGKSLGIQDSELNVWCQKVANQNHITDPTKIKANQTITLEGLSVEKNPNTKKNESNNDAVPQNNATQPIKNNETNNKQTAQQTDYIVQNGETPEAIVKKMYIASGNALDVNSAEFKEAVADFIDVNKDQIKNFGGQKGFIVGSTVKLPGEYDTTKMGMKSKEEAISSYTSIIKAQEDKKAAETKKRADINKAAADAAERAKAAKAALDKTTAELAKLRKGDGHISAGEKLACTGKGLLKSITSLWSDENGNFSGKKLLKTFAVAAVCTVAVVATGGAATPLLVAAGATMGAIQVTKGAIKASKATTNDEARAAWTDIGEGSGTLLMSCAGARGALKGARIPTAELKTAKNGMLAIKEMNAFKATAKCMTNAPKSLKASYTALKDVSQVKANLKSPVKTLKGVFTRKAKPEPVAQEVVIPKAKTSGIIDPKTTEATKTSGIIDPNTGKEVIHETVSTSEATSSAASSANKTVKEKFSLKSLVPKFLKKKSETLAKATTTTEATSAKAMKTKLQSEHNSLKTEFETTKSSADKQQIQQDMNKIEGELFNKSRGSKLIKMVKATKERLQSQLEALQKELETTKSPADKQKIEQEIAQIKADLEKQPIVQVKTKAKETAETTEKGKFKIKMPKIKLPKIFKTKAQPITNKEALTNRYNKLKERIVMVPVTNTSKRVKIQMEMNEISVELQKL